MKRSLLFLATTMAAVTLLGVDVAAATKKKDQSRLVPTDTKEVELSPSSPPKAKDQSKLPPNVITYQEARKICARKYGLFYRAVVRNGRVTCYL